MDKKIEETLYHVTTEDNANRILKDDKIRKIEVYNNFVYQGKRHESIKKDPGSLGYGFYLFSTHGMAKAFGDEKISETEKILKLDISLKREELLDLTNQEHLTLYNKYKLKFENLPIYEQYKQAFVNSSSGQAALEGALIDHFINRMFQKMAKAENKEVKKIKCVKAFTVTQIRISKNSFVANGIEYCVKINNVITNIEEA